MNNAQLLTEYKNKISVLALLCWCQLREETNTLKVMQE